ncbi:MAG: hypothetical protein R3F59_38850, partial [Myxococcota bacterium]
PRSRLVGLGEVALAVGPRPTVRARLGARWARGALGLGAWADATPPVATSLPTLSEAALAAGGAIAVEARGVGVEVGGGVSVLRFRDEPRPRALVTTLPTAQLGLTGPSLWRGALRAVARVRLGLGVVRVATDAGPWAASWPVGVDLGIQARR